MKKLVSVVLGLFLFGQIISCGGSGGGTPTPTATKTYNGAMALGDYAVMSYNTDDSFTYTYTGAHFPSGTTANMDTTAMTATGTTAFYTLANSHDGVGFLGDNLGFARIDGNGPTGQDTYAVGLLNTPTPTEANVPGTYVIVTSGGTIMTAVATAGGAFTLTPLGGTTQNGCWQLKSTTNVLEAWIAADCSTTPTTFGYLSWVRVASSGLKAIVTDAVDGTGFSAGLEQAAAAIGSSKDFFMMCSDGGNMYKVSVAAGTGGGNPTWEFFQAQGDGSWLSMGTGSIVLNQDCDATAINGVSCASLTAGTESGLKFDLLIDMTNGYIFAYDSSVSRFCAGGSS